MKSKIREKLAIGLLLFILAFVTYGCGESGGSSSVEPFADEPMIVDSALCININNDRPDGVTDSFLTTDDKIYVWVYWAHVEGTSTAKAVWYKPDAETPYREDSQVMKSDSGFGITWFYIDKPIGGFEDGEWLVEIYLDGEFHKSYLFSVG